MRCLFGMLHSRVLSIAMNDAVGSDLQAAVTEISEILDSEVRLSDLRIGEEAEHPATLGDADS